MRLSWKNWLVLGILGASGQYLHYIYTERQKRKEIFEVHFTNINVGCCFRSKKGCDKPNCAKRIEQRIIHHIDRAQSLICLAMFLLNHKAFHEALRRAKKRGVLIRVVTTKGQLDDPENQIHQLKKHGFNVRWFEEYDEDHYMHHKFCLIDVLIEDDHLPAENHSTNGVIITGSFNWTSEALQKNWENILITSKREICVGFRHEFDIIWQKSEISFDGLFTIQNHNQELEVL